MTGSAWVTRLRGIAHPLLNFCYPGRCVACARSFDADGNTVVLCSGCEVEMAAVARAPRCGCCAMPAAVAGADCPHCGGNGVYPYQQLLALGVLRNPLRRVIHHMKYAGRWVLAEELADRLLQQEDVLAALAAVDVIIPVPLATPRQVQRGFNQADVLARRLGKRTKIPVVHPVRRMRDTTSQAQIKARAKRFENLRHAFSLDPGQERLLKGKRVLVVDDVLTTGATMIWMGRTLKAARPESLTGLLAAVADPKGRQFETI